MYTKIIKVIKDGFEWLLGFNRSGMNAKLISICGFFSMISIQWPKICFLILLVGALNLFLDFEQEIK